MKALISNLDFWGLTTSLLCAIHCALLPLLIPFGLLSSSMAWINHPLFEITMAILTVFFVYQSLLKGFATGHVHRSTFIIAVAGLALILIHHFLGQLATAAVVSGGIMIAFAHFQRLYIHRISGTSHHHIH